MDELHSFYLNFCHLECWNWCLISNDFENVGWFHYKICTAIPFFSIQQKNWYHIPANSFRPWIVSAAKIQFMRQNMEIWIRKRIVSVKTVRENTVCNSMFDKHFKIQWPVKNTWCAHTLIQICFVFVCFCPDFSQQLIL